MCFFHIYMLGKYFNHKFTRKYFSPSTVLDTMPVWGNTDVLGQNGRGKVNRSGPTHYDISMSLHYA